MSETCPHTGPTIVGQVLGSYRILAEITSGGMGTVFRAEHVLLGRPAAVKVLRPDLTTSTQLVQRFVNEAKAVTACKHPGIVEVYDFGYTPDDHAFIVMELLEGEPLGKRLQRARLAELEAAAIACGIASALKAAHRVGVIHRDLKPDNVFLVPDPDGGPDRPKVLDFGIAKLADPSPTDSRTRHTQTGVLIGTPLYMAPEQAREAGTIDHRADLYSLGCIIYHMLVGRPPFVAEGGGEIIALQMFGEVEPPSRLAAVTPEMEQLVLRLLEKEPADRFSTAADVAGALAAIAARLSNRATWPSAAGSTELVVPGSHPGTPPPRDTRVDGVPPPRSRPGMRLLGGVAAVAIAAGAGVLSYTMLRDDHGTPGGVSSPTPTTFSPPGTAASATAATASPPAATATSPAATASPPAATATSPAATASPPAAASSSPAAASSSPPAPPVESRPVSAPAAAAAAPVRRAGGRPARKGDAAREARPENPGLPDRAIEVLQEVRSVEPPRSGEHTLDSSPIETTVDFARKRSKPPDSAPSAPPATAPPKDPTSP